MTWSIQVEVEKNGEFLFCLLFSVLFFLNLWLRPFATRIVVVFVVVKHENQNWRVFSFFFITLAAKNGRRLISPGIQMEPFLISQPKPSFSTEKCLMAMSLIWCRHSTFHSSWVFTLINVWFGFIRSRKTSLHIMLLFCVLSMYFLLRLDSRHTSLQRIKWNTPSN